MTTQLLCRNGTILDEPFTTEIHAWGMGTLIKVTLEKRIMLHLIFTMK